MLFVNPETEKMRQIAVQTGESLDEVIARIDRAKTGRHRCIGCGKFLRDKGEDWNQCAECDTRDPEDY